MERLDHSPHPDWPGWRRWDLRGRGRFYDAVGEIIVRRQSATAARVRLVAPGRDLSNIGGGLHGGAILAFADMALFAAAHICGVDNGFEAATIDLSLQFLAPGRADVPLDADVEVLRETGRLIFLRICLVQNEAICAAGHATAARSRAAPTVRIDEG